MSAESVREAAERDAAAAEADEAQDDDAAQPEPEPQPEPQPEPEPEPAPQAVFDFDKARRTMETAATKYEKTVRGALGDDAELLEPCPLCQIPSFVFPFDPASPDAEARMQAVADYFGGGSRNLKDAPDAERCEFCDGYGEVNTNSRNPLHLTKLCERCGGTGWHGKTAEQPQQPYVPVTGEVLTQPPSVGNGALGPDVWGRPAGHPHYGIAPAMAGA